MIFVFNMKNGACLVFRIRQLLGNALEMYTTVSCIQSVWTNFDSCSIIVPPETIPLETSYSFRFDIALHVCSHCSI